MRSKLALRIIAGAVGVILVLVILIPLTTARAEENTTIYFMLNAHVDGVNVVLSNNESTPSLQLNWSRLSGNAFRAGVAYPISWRVTDRGIFGTANVGTFKVGDSFDLEIQNIPNEIARIDFQPVINGTVTVRNFTVYEIIVFDEDDEYEEQNFSTETYEVVGLAGSYGNPFNMGMNLRSGVYFFFASRSDGFITTDFHIEYDNETVTLHVSEGYTFFDIANAPNPIQFPFNIQYAPIINGVVQTLLSQTIVRSDVATIAVYSELRATPRPSSSSNDNGANRMNHIGVTNIFPEGMEMFLLGARLDTIWSITTTTGEVVASGVFNLLTSNRILAENLDNGRYILTIEKYPFIEIAETEYNVSMNGTEPVNIDLNFNPLYQLEVLRQTQGVNRPYNFELANQTFRGTGTRIFAVAPNSFFTVVDLDDQINHGISIESSTYSTRLILGDGRIVQEGREHGDLSSPKTDDPINLAFIIVIGLSFIGGAIFIAIYRYRVGGKN
jgi:hypothetical protein